MRGDAERDRLRARGDAEWERLDRVYLSREWERDALVDDFRASFAGDFDPLLLLDFLACTLLVAVSISSCFGPPAASIKVTAGTSAGGCLSPAAGLSVTALSTAGGFSTVAFSVAVGTSLAFSDTTDSSAAFSFLGDLDAESAAFFVVSFFLVPLAFELTLLLLELDALLLREVDEEPDELLPDELDEELVELWKRTKRNEVQNIARQWHFN